MSKHAGLRPGNLPALPAAEAREALRVFARHRRTIVPLPDRLALLGARLGAVGSVLIRPRALGGALARRIRDRLARRPR